jgi:hypothetical protein
MNLSPDNGNCKAKGSPADTDAAVLMLEGLVASSRDLDTEQKVDLLQFLASLSGASPSRHALRFALHIGKEEGVW